MTHSFTFPPLQPSPAPAPHLLWPGGGARQRGLLGTREVGRTCPGKADWTRPGRGSTLQRSKGSARGWRGRAQNPADWGFSETPGRGTGCRRPRADRLGVGGFARLTTHPPPPHAFLQHCLQPAPGARRECPSPSDVTFPALGFCSSCSWQPKETSPETPFSQDASCHPGRKKSTQGSSA